MEHSFKYCELYIFLGLDDLIQEGDEYLTTENNEFKWIKTTLVSGLTQVKESAFKIYRRQIKQHFIKMDINVLYNEE